MCPSGLHEGLTSAGVKCHPELAISALSQKKGGIQANSDCHAGVYTAVRALISLEVFNRTAAYHTS